MEYQNIANLLDTTSDNLRRFITEKQIEVQDQSGSPEDRYKPSKQIRFKISMLRLDICDYSDAYIVVTGNIRSRTKIKMMTTTENQLLKIMYHLLLAFQRLMES